MKKFYLGAAHIGQAVGNGHDAACMRETADEAIAEAIIRVQKEHIDCVVVVEVIAVVRKDYPPVVVDRLR